MAIRNTAGRRIPGEPLSGVLRQTARQARRSVRPSQGPQGDTGPQGEAGPQGPCGPSAPGVTAAAVAVLTCDETGVATWTYPAMTQPPQVVATPVGHLPLVVTVDTVTEAAATIRIWYLDGSVAVGASVNAAAFGTVAAEPETID